MDLTVDFDLSALEEALTTATAAERPATGYICKKCGKPSPAGVGYATSATDEPADLKSCECGYSQLAELPAPQHSIRVARRVKMHEAKAWFDTGGDVVISSRGHEQTCPVSRNTVVHNNRSTTWEQLRNDVNEWRNRYPNQRYYIVPTDGVEASGGDEPTAAAEPTVNEQPTSPTERLDAAAPTLAEAIVAGLTRIFPGENQRATDRRNEIFAAIAAELTELYVYGVDFGGLIPIGQPIVLNNALIEVDAGGDAVRIICDGGMPIWDNELR